MIDTRISVVIPAYNEEKRLGECLSHLAKQQERPDEIIVVDNDSTDATTLIAKSCGVRVVREKQRGMIFARNRGFNEAYFPIIARTDADCLPPPEWIKIIKHDFATGDIDGLTGPVIFYDLPFRTAIFDTLYLNFVKLLQSSKETLQGPNMIITRSMWKRVKHDVCLTDKQVHEDVDLAIHILAAHGVIRRNPRLIMCSSGRRIVSNPQSFFGEYTIRFFNTFRIHAQKKINRPSADGKVTEAHLTS
ncbi:glycosyltransferase family 2 protein [Candidatus Roizmanbacteria bacterium]|nr:glycosyltransferase family 2 protein [Candidatus Roizmanbacteria bacterium]